jgi:hypothetical protein
VRKNKMKTYKKATITILFVVAALAVIPGCKYDVAEPKWYSDPATTGTPVINQIIPAAVAGPGVKTITINGENFSPDVDGNVVLFGSTSAEVISQSSTQIVVYRPNLVTDSCMLTIGPRVTYNSASAGPYKITSVERSYCILPTAATADNVTLTAIVVDNSEKVYIVRKTLGIYRIDTAGTIDSLMKSPTSSLTDAVIGPDGRLYTLSSNATAIRVMTLTSGAIAGTWKSASKISKYGDFDANGYFYAGGTNVLFSIIPPTGTVRTDTSYVTSTVMAVRVCSSYVYVAARIGTSTKIYRHNVSVAGTFGSKELFYDWSASPYASRNVTSMAFANDGTMYVGTDASSNPIVSITPQGTTDYLYKDILPGYCNSLAWGAGNYLYMVTGNTASGIAWVTYRIAMGTTKASR